MASVDIPKTFGALLLGGLFAAALLDVVAVQIAIYVKLYPGDGTRLKALVPFIWSLDTCHTGFIWAALWEYLNGYFGAEEKIDFIPCCQSCSLPKDNSSENTARARLLSGEILSLVTATAPLSSSVNPKLGYSNYDFDAVGDINWAAPDKAKLVFAKNYPRLQKIKARYDPDNIFNRWFPIIPA